MEKSGLQRLASQYRVIFIHPDTSPRGVDLPGDSDSWDFGKGGVIKEQHHYLTYHIPVKWIPGGKILNYVAQ